MAQLKCWTARRTLPGLPSAKPSSLDQSACDLSTLDGLAFSRKSPADFRIVRTVGVPPALRYAPDRSRGRSHVRRRMAHRRRRMIVHGLSSRRSPDSRTMQARRSRCPASMFYRSLLTSSYFCVSLIALSNNAPEPMRGGAVSPLSRLDDFGSRMAQLRSLGDSTHRWSCAVLAPVGRVGC